MRVRWAPAALTDRRRHFEFLDQRHPPAAENFLLTVRAKAKSLTIFPHRGRPGAIEGTRELTTAYPYVMVYHVDEGQAVVTILRLWHGAEDR